MKCNLTLCSCAMGAMPQCPDFDVKVTSPTQEPVGWAWLNTNMAEVLFRGNCMEGLTPLYTHPMRELTEEEIKSIGARCCNWMDFYTEIKKAQGK